MQSTCGTPRPPPRAKTRGARGMKGWAWRMQSAATLRSPRPDPSAVSPRIRRSPPNGISSDPEEKWQDRGGSQKFGTNVIRVMASRAMPSGQSLATSSLRKNSLPLCSKEILNSMSLSGFRVRTQDEICRCYGNRALRCYPSAFFARTVVN